MVGRVVLGEKGDVEAEVAEVGLVEGRSGGKPEPVIVDELQLLVCER
jgi:hypothetical protein